MIKKDKREKELIRLRNLALLDLMEAKENFNKAVANLHGYKLKKGE